MLSRSENCALFLGRVFVAALFLPSGFSKLMAFSAFAASLRAKGMPYPRSSLASWWLPSSLDLWPCWSACGRDGRQRRSSASRVPVSG